LKNERAALPLDRSKVRTVVVVGPNAAAAQPGQLPANSGGGGSGAVTPFPTHNGEADYYQGITVAAGVGVNVKYLPAPAPDFTTLAHARTAAGGEAGLTLKVQVTGTGDAVEIPSSVQKGVNLAWTTGQLPQGVPAGRNATFTWSGVLVAPTDGDFELRVNGNPTVTLDGKRVAAGELVHLAKDQAVPIQVELAAVANPPAGRGGRGGGGGRGGATPSVQVALVPPVPDVAQMKSADAVVVCVGLSRNTESEGRDRPFELPATQQYLIRAAAAANPRTIVINNSGAAVGMMQWPQQIPAIVQAWYIGQEGGTAIGEMLFGDINPSGRLCSTFDRTFEENPAFANYPGQNLPGMTYPTVKYEEGIFYGYRGYDKAGKAPLFPFGHGLSYTTFACTNLKAAKAGASVTVALDVKNTGPRAGAEVVQVYVGEQGCPLPRPVRELKGFAKVQLNAGETRHVEIPLGPEAFAYWSPDKKDWVTDTDNTFTVEVGESERDIKLKQSVTLK
jgi:beta-glucosidase